MMPITTRSLAPNTRALKEGCDRTPNPTAAVVRPRNFLRVTALLSMANHLDIRCYSIFDMRSQVGQTGWLSRGNKGYDTGTVHSYFAEDNSLI